VNLPLRFEPYLRPLVWGGRQLADVLGIDLPDRRAYGEAWLISDHASHASVVADGPCAGQTLRSLMLEEKHALLGPAGNQHELFPWLVKLLDASDWLSVQVHPSETDVQRLWPGECSKTEAWFILAAGPRSRIYAGLQPGVEEKHLRAALAEGTVEHCLHSFQPRPGDCIFLPAGTVHAVGGGILMAEIQQTSDATFRLFDWNRTDTQGQKRPLHIEEALTCMHWPHGPVQPIAALGYGVWPQPGTPPVRQVLVACPYFQLEYVRTAEPFALGCPGRLQVLLAVQGRGHLRSAEGIWPLKLGQTLLLPAARSEVTCHPQRSLGFLLSTLPPAV
jgi:mannose-6-phosphate isomerase